MFAAATGGVDWYFNGLLVQDMNYLGFCHDGFFSPGPALLDQRMGRSPNFINAHLPFEQISSAHADLVPYPPL
jgi:hypothetical protein